MEFMSMDIFDENRVTEEIEKETVVLSEEDVIIRNHAEKYVEQIIDGGSSSQNLLPIINDFGTDTARGLDAFNESISKLSKMEGGYSVAGSILQNLRSELSRISSPPALAFSKTKKIVSFFGKYDKAGDIISEILKKLEKGKKTLFNDCQALSNEQRNARSLLKKLKKESEMLNAMGDALKEKIAMLEMHNADEDDIYFLKTDVQYALEDRRNHLTGAIAAHLQAIVASEQIIRGNRFLLSEINSVKMVTIPTMRALIGQIRALYNQQRMAVTIGELNSLTGRAIEELTEKLGIAANTLKDVANTRIELYDVIEASLKEVIQKIDDIDAFQREAVKVMQNSTAKLQAQNKHVEAAVDRMQKGGKLLKEKPYL